MKKFIVAATLAAGLLSAAGASAARPQCPVNANREAAVLANRPGDTCAQACRQPRFNPFEGIELTADQQTAIQNLNNTTCQNRQNARNERRERNEATRESRLQSRRDYLAQLKQILTPEQYVSFLENSYLNPRAGADNKARDGRRGRDSRAERRSSRQSAATQSAATQSATTQPTR